MSLHHNSDHAFIESSHIMGPELQLDRTPLFNLVSTSVGMENDFIQNKCKLVFSRIYIFSVSYIKWL